MVLWPILWERLTASTYSEEPEAQKGEVICGPGSWQAKEPFWLHSKSPFHYHVLPHEDYTISTSSITITITSAPYKFRKMKGREKEGGMSEHTVLPGAGLGSESPFLRPGSEHPRCHWVLLPPPHSVPPAARLLGAFPSFSPTSTQRHFRAVPFLRKRQQWKDLGQIYWWFLPSALMFSRPIYSKLKRRWNSRLTDVRARLEDPGPSSAELAWAGGREGGAAFGGWGVRHDCRERTHHRIISFSYTKGKTFLWYNFEIYDLKRHLKFFLKIKKIS